jgi:hypothetical protein
MIVHITSSFQYIVRVSWYSCLCQQFVRSPIGYFKDARKSAYSLDFELKVISYEVLERKSPKFLKTLLVCLFPIVYLVIFFEYFRCINFAISFFRT